jgi:hypothetical protein
MSAEMQNGRAMTEVIAPPVSDARALIPHADSAEANAERTRRAIAAFHMTLLLDDIVGAVRALRAADRLTRQREADGNPAEVDA